VSAILAPGRATRSQLAQKCCGHHVLKPKVEPLAAAAETAAKRIETTATVLLTSSSLVLKHFLASVVLALEFLVAQYLTSLRNVEPLLGHLLAFVSHIIDRLSSALRELVRMVREGFRAECLSGARSCVIVCWQSADIRRAGLRCLAGDVCTYLLDLACGGGTRNAKDFVVVLFGSLQWSDNRVTIDSRTVTCAVAEMAQRVETKRTCFLAAWARW